MTGTEAVHPASEDYAEETWIFTGQRADDKAKPWQMFEDGDGRSRRYHLAKAAYLIVGARYTVLVARTGGQVWLRGTPAFSQAPDPEEPRLAEWAAADRVAGIKMADAKRERNARRQDALDEAIRPLLQIAKAYRQRDDQDALAAYVIRQIHRAWATDGDPK